ncbi:uncharacterized protein LAJ45_09087 [Morchella importuna]|uniref:AMP-activated protein kinase glycogen-binding domain-containing protein n=1 Tax=Morchella conica CCBAS932 TaxID=1392247 RepID=A0A3N4KQ09_9PEZI|nr:uncharacterized protein LAJ45_09087 [Morchella importuna]KAH8146713.1 hypothetical protein LAJ45_09087 [Morchella importuna]RPB12597.1 hypothetical protein P167DRAFT_553576 [Morchella conica CCBAS932]
MSFQSTTFKLRTPAHIETCHLLGSWDKYEKKMSMAQDTAAGPGFWKITLKFPATPSRFWYYYVLDGYFESHDPNQPTCKEPTRGITLNILETGVASPREASPTSSTSSSRSSSRFPSPSSSISSRGSSPAQSERRRQQSPPRYRPASHIIQPVPRNPLAMHKLTLDTNIRPVSVMTSAATTCGDSPISSAYSSRSNSTVFSDEDSPITPIDDCDCPFTESHGHSYFEDDSSCSEYCSSEDEEEYERRQIRVSKRASYHPSKGGHGGQLAYELEQRLRM